MPETGEDWGTLCDRLLEGDRAAFATFNRLVSSYLTRLRAYDFRDEWDDLRQEILLATLANARAGRLRDPKAFSGYVRVITRNKFMDRLKRELRVRERDALPWDDEVARGVVSSDGPREALERSELWDAVESLSDEQQRLLTGVYVEGRTYQEVSDATGVPLGTLKRRLREGLAALRARLAPPDPTGDPP